MTMRTGLVIAALLVALCLPAAAGDKAYGAALTLTDTTPIADILDHPGKYKGKTVQVQGTISEMCAHKGCWLRVKDADGKVLLAKSSGDRITVPTDSTGKTVTVEGTVVLEPKRPTKDAGEEGHDCATAKIRLETLGVVLN
jgi:hypothetical protein